MTNILATAAFALYLAAGVARWRFQYRTGQAALWLGFKFRHYLDPETAHNAFMAVLRYQERQPKFVSYDWTRQ